LKDDDVVDEPLGAHHLVLRRVEDLPQRGVLRVVVEARAIEQRQFDIEAQRAAKRESVGPRTGQRLGHGDTHLPGANHLEQLGGKIPGVGHHRVFEAPGGFVAELPHLVGGLSACQAIPGSLRTPEAQEETPANIPSL
jgi:hypothetical protein